MTSQAGAAAGGVASGFVTWLTQAGLGPAAVALPVNLVADKLAKEAMAWFKRVRQTDDLSRLVKAAAGSSVDLSRDEVKALRDLLGKEETWRLLATTDELKVAELISQIAARLPACDGRAADDSLAAAGVIARGLMEFAVSRLAPDVFQQVVLARLGQMTSHASALNEALFRMHKDLYHRISGAKDLFQQVMDRLPPGRADLGEIRIYLAELIDWLNVDPWPSRRRSGGPVLTPAAIEHKLRISAKEQGHEQAIDADQLARQCSRLVILGGPGSGKTWLAKRTARRCAEQALTELADGAALDEVELPLYITCAWLAAAAPGDSIRRATVASALSHLPDLGGARIIDALRLRFEERNAPTLLVADSLDEAHGADDRVGEAGTLTKYKWRVVLTSRRSSWDDQLTIEGANPGHRVGELQPLRYPPDVEAVIQRWFADTPERGQALATQIAQRPSLQQAATVPLILAFYCILGGDELPEFRHKLYEQVVNRMLRSPWRPSSEAPQDVDACRAALRTWAWRGAKNDQVSGVGVWDDDIPTKDAQLSFAGHVAVDHIAAPQGGPDYETDETPRRFVHRSIREHLVAEYVRDLPASEAIAVLLPHLWYDPDWEYAAPAAIAMHPQRDKLLRGLLCRAARSDQIPGDLAVIDAEYEVRMLLAKITAESGEGEWPSELAAIIGQARADLAQSGIIGILAEAAHWPTSNRQVRQALLRHLAGDIEGWQAKLLADTLAQLDPTPGDKRQARDVLLVKLADSPSPSDLTGTLLQLEATPEDKERALRILLRRLADPANPYIPVMSAVALAQLDPVPADWLRARKVVLGLFADINAAATAGLEINAAAAATLVDTLVRLDPTPGDKRRAIDTLLSLLTGQVTALLAGGPLAEYIRSAQTTRERRQEADALLAQFRERAQADAAILSRALVQLDLTPDDKRQTRQVLLSALTGQAIGVQAPYLAARLLQLDPTPDDKRQLRHVLLGQLTGDVDGLVAAPWATLYELAGTLHQLDPTPDDMRRARDALLTLLTGQATRAAAEDQAVLPPHGSQAWGSLTAKLAVLVRELDPTPGDMRQARDVLLRQLACETDGFEAAQLAELLVELDPTPGDTRQAREALLGRFRGQDTDTAVESLAAALARLDPTPDDKRQAREALLARFQVTGVSAEEVAALVQLDPTPDNKRQARHALLTQLTSQATGPYLPTILVGLDPTPDDKRQAREVLLRLLASETGSSLAEGLAAGLAELDPTAADLTKVCPSQALPTAELLAAVRQNSALGEWLDALPSLSLLFS